MSTRTKSTWAWFLFDAGNSAHALLVSTVGFALYFRQYLYVDNEQADALWAIVTVITLSISAALAPFLGSWLQHKQKRWIGLVGATVISVIATIALGFDMGLGPSIVVAIYVISAIGYYSALPLYTSYLEETADGSIERTSSSGWALGYIGGIAAAAIALLMGSLTAPIADSPDRFRGIFVLAGTFNLLLSLPLLYFAWRTRAPVDKEPATQWAWRDALKALAKTPAAIRLLFSYWMVAEAATIALYFTAIFLGTYAGMPVVKIFALTMAVQFIAAIATWQTGPLAEKFGSAIIFQLTCLLWIAIPPLLWAVKVGSPYWIPLVMMGLVLGSHHALVRAEVVRIAKPLVAAERGSLFGFLEVSGRVSSIVGPLVVGLLAFVFELPEALLVAAVFPIIAFVVIRKYKWVDAAS